jgi:hypothetical protein
MSPHVKEDENKDKPEKLAGHGYSSALNLRKKLEAPKSLKTYFGERFPNGSVRSRSLSREAKLKEQAKIAKI